MAFVIENEDNPNAPNQAPLNQQAPISAGGAGVGGATKPSNTPGVNVPAQPSAQLSAYLAANQPQATEFGQKIAQGVGAQVNEAGQAIQPAVNTYTGNLYSVPTDATVNSAVASSPSSLTPEQKAAYQKELGAAGASPNAADTFETTSGYQDAAGKIQKAVTQADLWNSGNDVSSLTTALSPYEGQNATQGARTLDSLLLSRTPDAYQKIQQAVAPAAKFQGDLSSGTDAANAALRAAIAQNQSTTQGAQGSAQTYANNLNRTLADYLTNAQHKVIDYNSQINPIAQNLANVQPQIAELQNAIDAYNATLSGGPGTTGMGDGTKNFKPISYGQPGVIPSVIGNPDVAQLATSGQYSDLAALRELLGDSYFGSLNTSIKPEQSSLAGTWNPETNATIPNLSMLLDPVTSPAIQSMMPNYTEALKYGPIVQGNAPLSNNLKSIDAALNALLEAAGKQPWIGPTGPGTGGGTGSGTGGSTGGGTTTPPGGGTGGNTPQPPAVPDTISKIPGITFNEQGFPIFPKGGSANNPQDVANWTAYYNYVQTLYPGLAIYPPWSTGIHVL